MLNFRVELCDRANIKQIIETNHYSKSINGIHSQFCFKLMSDDILLGGMIYGKPAMFGQFKKYCNDENDIIELRRLALLNEAPKNSESFFIAKTLRWLKQNTRIKLVLSYADPNYGHQGIIYKATHFKYVGLTSNTKVIIYNNKKYHDKTIRAKYNGVLKPYAIKLKHALDNGEAYYKKQNGKHIFLYKIR